MVAFGSKHKGHAFKEAWADAEWVRWTLSNLHSDNMSAPQRRWIEFVQVQVEKAEQASSGPQPSASSDETEPPASGSETAPPVEPQPPASGGEAAPSVEPQMSANGGGSEAGLSANDRFDRMQAQIDALDAQIKIIANVVSQLVETHRGA